MKIKVQRYDYEQITSPSNGIYTLIDIGEFECDDITPSDELYAVLVHKCREINVTFRFYSPSEDPNYNYVVVGVPDGMKEQESKFMQQL